MAPVGVAVIGPQADQGFRLCPVPSPDPKAKGRRGEPAGRHPPKDGRTQRQSPRASPPPEPPQDERISHDHTPTTGKRGNTATHPRGDRRPERAPTAGERSSTVKHARPPAGRASAQSRPHRRRAQQPRRAPRPPAAANNEKQSRPDGRTATPAGNGQIRPQGPRIRRGGGRIRPRWPAVGNHVKVWRSGEGR